MIFDVEIDERARYIAQDKDGYWYWYSYKPTPKETLQVWDSIDGE